MKVTDHFSIEEFQQKALHGQSFKVYPGEWIDERLHPLVDTLEKIRARLGGAPIAILSGYRSAAYNEALYKSKGKEPTQSQHSEGRAADIIVSGIPAAQVHATIQDMVKNGELPNLGGLGKYPSFVHVDVRAPKPGKVGLARLARWDETEDTGVIDEAPIAMAGISGTGGNGSGGMLLALLLLGAAWVLFGDT